MSLRVLSRTAARTFPCMQSFTAIARARTIIQCSSRIFATRYLVNRSNLAPLTTSAVKSQNESLVAKLISELAMEESMRDSNSYSANIQDFIDNSAFEISDTPGQEEVVLTRTYNDESIRVTFSIADLSNLDADPESEPLDDEQAYLDEDDHEAGNIAAGQSGGANTKGSINQGRTKDGNVKVAPEDNISSADNAEFEGGDYDSSPHEASFPAHLTINIDRPGKGSLRFEAEARDGDITVQGINYFSKSDVADPKTAEKEYEGRALYTGPMYGSLDEDLQVHFEEFLNERGINTRMALFIPEFIDAKEQKEYMRWLANVKAFVE